MLAQARPSSALRFVINAACAGALLAGCRNEATSSRRNEAGAASGLSVDASSVEGAVDADGGTEAESTNERADEDAGLALGHDLGRPGADCGGRQLSLFAVLFEPRCEISEREWDTLSHPAGSDDKQDQLRQEARRDGETVVLSLVNGGRRPLVVPLRYHPSHPELAFSVLAETDGKVYELATPKLGPEATPNVEDAGVGLPEVPDPRGGGREAGARRWGLLAELDGGSPARHVYSARVRLPPRGRVSARLSIDPRIVRRLDRSCPDAGTKAHVDGGVSDGCLPTRLPAGRVVLHVGQLVSGIDAGPPARVEWIVP